MDAYDPVTDEFRFWGKGPFWNAVDRAHRLGIRGGGRKVAIIDTVFNLDLPFLKKRADRILASQSLPTTEAELNHGNAVALLISRIAPESRFDLYSTIDTDGKFSPDLVIQAVSEAAKSDVHVISTSLGISHIIPRGSINLETLLREGFWERKHSHRWLTTLRPDDPNCRICAAAEKATSLSG
jgi:uncharacterized membrane protein